MRRVLVLDWIDPLSFYGVNNARFAQLEARFSGLRLVGRGEELHAEGGDAAELESLERCLDRMARYYARHGALDNRQFHALLYADGPGSDAACEGDSTVLLHGAGGRMIRALTGAQRALREAVQSNDLLFAVGPAGTGKTYTAIALAVAALRRREVRRIVLTRPAVEAGERLGFLPGDLREKLDPYLQPLYDALNQMLPPRTLRGRMEEGVIQIAPLAYMRGRTLDDAFVILDEAQNATLTQMRMFLTRMGRNAKFIVTGDVTQVDLPDREQSGLARTMDLLAGLAGVSFVEFGVEGMVRHPLVASIVRAFARGQDTE